jgi:3-oxoacyl-[acyl-carrier protein] reductase
MIGVYALTLHDNIAIITGGAKGIGPFIVRALVQNGCKVVFTYKNSKSEADKLCNELPHYTRAFCADVRKPSDAKLLIDYTKDIFGGLNIIVNNAGILCDKPLMMMQRKDWISVIDTNLTGTYNVTRSAIVTLMKQRRGCIINISSVSGITGMPGQANYSASKAGVIGFTKALAKEVGRHNIRVNAIAPGFFDTDMIKYLKNKNRDDIIKIIPLGRLGEPREVANLVVFLASENARYITGQVIKIDGGLFI